MELDRGIPVVDISSDNIKEFLPVITSSVHSASFIAIDCELSGLGDRKNLTDPSVEERYRFASIVAKTRSIISLGLSLFRDCEEGLCKAVTYNVLTLCSEDYIVEPEAVKFLVRHGFDFNKQYSKGIPYKRGDDDQTDSLLRHIFAEIVRSGKPLVLHNGFIDLVFLYHNFYAILPSTLPSFLADLSEMFPAGIYDTKYYADYIIRLPASYLEFLFAKSQMENEDKGQNGIPTLKVEFTHKVLSSNFPLLQKLSNEEDFEDKELCQSYSNHGHCPEEENCTKSHNVQLIVRTKFGKRKKLCNDDFPAKPLKKKIKYGSKPPKIDAHRAGIDAFMTAYSFATAIFGEKADNTKFLLRNKVYLVCKEFPLMIRKSTFAKNSLSHAKKMRNMKAGMN